MVTKNEVTTHAPRITFVSVFDQCSSATKFFLVDHLSETQRRRRQKNLREPSAQKDDVSPSRVALWAFEC